VSREGREHFIPFRKRDILEICAEDGALSPAEARRFRDLARILESVFHFEFHRKLEELKDCYAPFDPDADTRCIRVTGPAERKKLQKLLVERLGEILRKANYEPLSREELEYALREESFFKIRLHIDFDDFEEFLFFHRGTAVKRERVVTRWGLRRKTVEVPVFERVLVFVKFKGEEYFSAKKRKTALYSPGSMILKLFHNIPTADIDMLFPNTEVRMKTIDKLFMGIPAVAGGVMVVVTKWGAVLGLMVALIMFWLGFRSKQPDLNPARLVALGGAIFALASYLVKQWMAYKNRKIRFMKALTENLYFRNLDNNAGVFHHLVDEAEEEETKEAMLAYYFLLKEKRPLKKVALDGIIERWFKRIHGCSLDFDVGDALEKLRRLELVEAMSAGWRAVPLEEALRRLGRRWNDYFPWS